MDLKVFLQDISQAALRTDRDRAVKPQAAHARATAVRTLNFTRENLSRRTTAVIGRRRNILHFKSRQFRRSG